MLEEIFPEVEFNFLVEKESARAHCPWLWSLWRVSKLSKILYLNILNVNFIHLSRNYYLSICSHCLSSLILLTLLFYPVTSLGISYTEGFYYEINQAEILGCYLWVILKIIWSQMKASGKNNKILLQMEF